MKDPEGIDSTDGFSKYVEPSEEPSEQPTKGIIEQPTEQPTKGIIEQPTEFPADGSTDGATEPGTEQEPDLAGAGSTVASVPVFVAGLAASFLLSLV
jgi:hypothetical protein